MEDGDPISAVVMTMSAAETPDQVSINKMGRSGAEYRRMATRCDG